MAMVLAASVCTVAPQKKDHLRILLADPALAITAWDRVPPASLAAGIIRDNVPSSNWWCDSSALAL